MKHSKKEYLKILTRYHAFGLCDDYDTLITMIADEFKDHTLRDKVITKSGKIDHYYNDYYDAEDYEKFFNKLWDNLSK